MENKKYVYYDSRDFEYCEINEEYLESPEKFKSYFGYFPDERVDSNNEIVIYELVPVKRFKKK